MLKRLISNIMKCSKILKLNNKGWIFYEVIITLIITIIIIPILFSCLKITVNMKFYDENIQDEIKTIQLQRIFLIAYDIKLDNNQIDFKYNNQIRSLKFINNHIILTPGTQVFYEDVDLVKFELNEDEVKIIYFRNEEIYEKNFKFK